MSCTCDSSTDNSSVMGGGCCSIHDNPNGTPIRFVLNAGTGAPSGTKLNAYQVDGAASDITASANQRFVIYALQVVVRNASDVHVYRGTSAAADSSSSNTIIRGFCSDYGGIAMNLPLIRLAADEEVYVKTAAESSEAQLDVVGYGVLETIPS